MDMLTQAGQGWSKILGRQSDWTSHFSLDAKGMNTGFMVYALSALIALVAAGFRFGLAAPAQTFGLVAWHVIPLLVLIIVTSIFKRLVTGGIETVNFIVPSLYLLALMKLVEAVSYLIGFSLLGAILAVTGILSFRLALANGLKWSWAAGYGLAIFALLAAWPLALYAIAAL